MSTSEEEIIVSPELSEEFKSLEEFCSENSGRELDYLGVVESNPLQMDSLTLAFSMRHFLRLSRNLMNLLVNSLNGDTAPTLKEVLATKGIDLDKSQAARLRQIIFAFRDSVDDEIAANMVKALQLMTISRERRRVMLSLGETYAPPDEGWLPEDFGGDDTTYETIRSIEDPRWMEREGD